MSVSQNLEISMYNNKKSSKEARVRRLGVSSDLFY